MIQAFGSVAAIMEQSQNQTEKPVIYPLNYLYFYLTDGCNLRCRHCWIKPIYQPDGAEASSIDPQLLRSIVKQGLELGLKGVKLTGGEPLIHPRIGDILDFIKTSRLKLDVETNGVECSPALVKKMAACRDVFVSVSLDAADPEIHDWMRGVDGSFNLTVMGIRRLVEAGIRPQIIMSLVKRNRDQMEALVGLAESLGASSVKFNVVQPTARGEVLHRNSENLSIEELVALGRKVNTEMRAKTGLRLIYSQPAAFRPLSELFARDVDGCQVCGVLGILGVLGNGLYALCGIGQTVQELVFGNASEDSLASVWENSEVLNAIRRGLPSRLTGICGRCLMKGLCMGACIAQNYYRASSLWAPFWYCEEADRAGLFPETRKAIV